MSFDWLSPERRTASVIARDTRHQHAASNNEFSVIERPSPARDTYRFHEMRQNLQDFSQRVSAARSSSAHAAAAAIVQRPPSLPSAAHHHHHHVGTTSTTTPSKTLVHADSQWSRQHQHLGRPTTLGFPGAASAAAGGGVKTVSLLNVTGNPQPLKIIVDGARSTTAQQPPQHGQQQPLPRSEEEVARLRSETANAEQVGRTLFEQQRQHQINVAAAAALPLDSASKKKVVTEERPAWIGPLDAGGFPLHDGGQTPTTSRRRGQHTPSSYNRAHSGGKKSTTGGNNNSSSKDGKDELHLLQDGRCVVFRGSTRQRLTEESLYTGQSKARFAWKKDVDGLLQYAAQSNYYPPHHHHHHHHVDVYEQAEEQLRHGGPNSGSQNVVAAFVQGIAYAVGGAGGSTTSPRVGAAAAADVDTTTPKASRAADVSSLGGMSSAMLGGTPPAGGNRAVTAATGGAAAIGGGVTSSALAAAAALGCGGGESITPLAGRRPPEPAVLYLMNGTGHAAETLRRARTEGERRTAETLMKREAWKALHPGALEWGERQWKDTLRPGVTSGRGGADSFEDAKNFAMYKKERPLWRFPAPQGPTMMELREAPLVVNLSLDDLKMTQHEEEDLEARRERDEFLQRLKKEHERRIARRSQSVESAHVGVAPLSAGRSGSRGDRSSSLLHLQHGINNNNNTTTVSNNVSAYNSARRRTATTTNRPDSPNARSGSGASDADAIIAAISSAGSASTLPPPPTFTYGSLSFSATPLNSRSAAGTPSADEQQQQQQQNLARTHSPSIPTPAPVPAASSAIHLPPDRNDFAVSKAATGGLPINHKWSASPVPLTPRNAPFVLPSQAVKQAVATFAAPTRCVALMTAADNPVKMRLLEEEASMDRTTEGSMGSSYSDNNNNNNNIGGGGRSSRSNSPPAESAAEAAAKREHLRRLEQYL